MNVTFYNNLSNYNVVNKRLEEINTLSFTFKENSNIINPSLILKNYEGGNYCYIEELKKYYYVKDIDLLGNGLFKINCEIDVLMTYKEDIINNDFYSKDGVLVITNNEIDFSSIYDISKFLLIIGG
jgi:hypothetical protein